MRQKEVNRMDVWQVNAAIKVAAEEVDQALNLCDHEPLRRIMWADNDTDIDAGCDDLLRPECSCRGECDHAFPRSFVEGARGEVGRLRRLCKQALRRPEQRAWPETIVAEWTT